MLLPSVQLVTATLYWLVLTVVMVPIVQLVAVTFELEKFTGSLNVSTYLKLLTAERPFEIATSALVVALDELSVGAVLSMIVDNVAEAELGPVLVASSLTAFAFR